MSIPFIQLDVFAKIDGILSSVSVRIEKPVKDSKGFYVAPVEFSLIDKYNAKLRGADEFNAVSGALRYVDKILENSTEPEFFWAEGQSTRTS